MDELHEVPNCRVVKRSSLYVSAAVGGPPQPDYINAVCTILCRAEARDLLRTLQEIERRHGRRRSQQVRYGPRTLDLDLLLYGDVELNEPGLIVPHPRIHERRFVLLPLSEIAPRLYIPGRGVVYKLLENEEIRQQRVVPAPARA